MEIRTETVRKKIFLLREIAPKYECFDYIFNCCIITMLHSRVSFNLLLSTSLPCQQRGWSTPSGVLLLQYFDIALWLFWDVTLDFVHYSRIYNIKLFKYVMTKCDASGYTSQQLSETWLAIMNSLIRRGRRWWGGGGLSVDWPPPSKISGALAYCQGCRDRLAPAQVGIWCPPWRPAQRWAAFMCPLNPPCLTQN